MKRLNHMLPLLLLAGLQTAQAQTFPPPAPGEVLGPKLPIPDVDEDAPPKAFLEAARLAIVTNDLGRATEALERAESRALIRSVRPSRAGVPSAQPMVQAIRDARTALDAGDRAEAVRRVDAAMKLPEDEAQ